jgi:bis(5'-nucleosyl)-tetraphosphatase (symmetrical)
MYLIGDVQGCHSALQRLLHAVGFSPSRDTVYLLGDLVNRGPQSRATLDTVMALGDAARSILGNHDLHLIATHLGMRPPGKHDTLAEVLAHPKVDAYIDWLRQQPLVRHEHGVLMVHAGLWPTWTPDDAVTYAQEVSNALKQSGWRYVFASMYGNLPQRWHDDLSGDDRLRALINICTRMRYLKADGTLDFKTTAAPDQAPCGLVPWYAWPQRATRDVPVAIGHWSTLGGPDSAAQAHGVWALDSGCVWGGALTALRFTEGFAHTEWIQVHCEAAQRPGD